ncbi:MAG: hypothetical protein QOF35_1803 [Actinomycetota bacterium]|nr:hypothetical protein [Actinomycetota bacterium]
MRDKDPTEATRRNKRLAGAAGLLLAGGLAGGYLAATSSASADNATSTVSTPNAASQGDRGGRPGENALTGTNAATARAAALKAVPGGTVVRLETDVDGSIYEAHMTKADGSRVTVKFDKNFKVASVEDGMGGGGHDGSRDGSAPNANGTSL